MANPDRKGPTRNADTLGKDTIFGSSLESRECVPVEVNEAESVQRWPHSDCRQEEWWVSCLTKDPSASPCLVILKEGCPLPKASLPSVGLQRVGHNWSDLACTHTWRADEGVKYFCLHRRRLHQDGKNTFSLWGISYETLWLCSMEKRWSEHYFEYVRFSIWVCASLGCQELQTAL